MGTLPGHMGNPPVHMGTLQVHMGTLLGHMGSLVCFGQFRTLKPKCQSDWMGYLWPPWLLDHLAVIITRQSPSGLQWIVFGWKKSCKMKIKVEWLDVEYHLHHPHPQRDDCLRCEGWLLIKAWEESTLMHRHAGLVMNVPLIFIIIIIIISTQGKGSNHVEQCFSFFLGGGRGYWSVSSGAHQKLNEILEVNMKHCH